MYKCVFHPSCNFQSYTSILGCTRLAQPEAVIDGIVELTPMCVLVGASAGLGAGAGGRGAASHHPPATGVADHRYRQVPPRRLPLHEAPARSQTPRVPRRRLALSLQAGPGTLVARPAATPALPRATAAPPAASLPSTTTRELDYIVIIR